MSGLVKEFTDENFNSDVLGSDLPVVVDFWAEWCGPCKMLTPILQEIAGEIDGKYTIGKVNVDDNPQVAAKYGIVSIPTMLFIKGGKVLEQQTGLLPKAALAAKIEKVFA